VTVTTEQGRPTQVRLRRAQGVELIGEMAGSGYRVPPSLVRRVDGQTIQLTPLLYATLLEIDGHRSESEIAAAVSASTGRTVSEDNIRHFVDEKLRPLGLLIRADGSEPPLKKRSPLLGLRFRYAVTDPDRTRRLTDPFRFLFRPWVAAPLLVAFVAVCWWVFMHKGLASAAYDAFERPGLLILVFAVTILSAGFHEFGHAAAARYGGATPGVMGFGLYLVWPAFYTDVTDSYRLGRGGRLRTDLGGLYFNAVVAVAITGLWLWLRYDALLLVVATQIIQMLRQLAPLVRFDGYHVLADLTGVPDLYGRIKPTVLGMLPWRWRDARASELKPWARIVVSLWVVTVVPLLIGTLAIAVIALPRVMGTAWASLNKQHDVLTTAWTDGDMVQASARVLAIVAIVIPMAGIIYLLVRIVRHSVTGTWRATTGKPVLRLLAVMVGVSVLSGVAYAWVDKDNYRPIQPGERGTLGDIALAIGAEWTNSSRSVDTSSRPVAASRSLVAGQRGVMQALWDTRTPPPTIDSPQLAVILVPKMPVSAANGGGRAGIGNPSVAVDDAASGDSGEVTAPTAAAPTTNVPNPPAAVDEGWVFPVDKPLVPGPGDNQALAVNTADNSVEYEAAFAMVYVTDNKPAMNVNEAHAYASCDSCAAVAVAYQVVFVIDTDAANDNVAVPQNLAGALNYDCVNCLTYAIARQLFVTLDEPLSEEAMIELNALWEEIAAYEQTINAEEGEMPTPDEIAAALDAYTEEIMAIVEADQPGTFSTVSTAPSSSTAPSTSAAVTPTPSATVAPPSDSSTAPPSASATVDPTATDETTAAEPTDESTSSEPTQPAGSTSTGTTTDSTTSGGSEEDTADESTADTSSSDGSTSGGSTSGGTESAP
jgi:putative peptide zinc metalloprotease protein